jgi:cytochrome b subunit of formate dehydrogenase
MLANASEQETYYRFCVLHRVLHIVVAIGFTGLAVTGFSLAFSSLGPVQGFVGFFGGAGTFGYFHRFFAVVAYSCVVAHGFWFLYYKAALKGSLFGPQSIFPGKQDFRDLYDHILYLLAQRKSPPSFNRFAYWEKFDYWAVFLGMQTMGVTGLFLWFPEFFTRFFPGFFINLAQILHFYEAIMAVVLKLFIHTATAHLRPEVYPGDWCIFTGKTTRERIIEHHPGEWEAMNASIEDSSVKQENIT